MAKKPAPKKAAKPAKKAAAKKPAKKAAPAKKAVAKKPVKKAAPAKKAATGKAKKPLVKAKPVVKKPTPKAKPIAKKPAPKPAPKKAPAKAAPAKPTIKAVVKPTPKTTVPAPKPIAAKAVPIKEVKAVAAPAAAPAGRTAPAPRKRIRNRGKQENVKAPPPIVKQVSRPAFPAPRPAMAKIAKNQKIDDRARYNDEELEEFKGIINKKLDEARKDFDLLKQTLANTDNNGTDDTSPSFKMIEDGSETLSREETAQLASRQEKFIKHLEDALLRIRNKTYGICRVTGKLISKDRLRLVPHATLSIEAKQQMST